MVVAVNLDEDNEEADGFGVQVEPPEPATADEVIAAIDRAVHENPAIDGVQWWGRWLRSVRAQPRRRDAPPR